MSEGPRRVLVVDDDDDQALLLSELLRQEGYEVLVCSDGEQALRRWQDFDPEVALIDLQMPHINGLSLARAARAVYPASACTLIAMTGYGHPEIKNAAAEAGFARHLVKPPDIPELLGMLRELLPPG